ncbi:hypothetical protein MWH25_07530 [Natroniella acetigena]|uniref:hypothetical protein n=1 Tax=Natroniella acetigena TaxID=52004 RepID=UPI00200ADD55|nr:hypothetical protein [Natroniella acetigena]MCK8827591.1 hypothetical protein [Natroniella acetigena]
MLFRELCFLEVVDNFLILLFLNGLFRLRFNLTYAAVTSAISLLEVVVAYIVDEHEWERKKAAQVVGIIIFLVGVPPLLGYSALSDFEYLGMDLLDTYDWFANTIFLPFLGCFLTLI